jgi:hypothetical protein
MNFQGMGSRRFCRWVSLNVGVPFTGNYERYWKEGSGNGAPLFTGALLGQPGGVKEGFEDGHLFPWGFRWETWERAHVPEAYVWKKVLGRVSLHTEAPLGDLGRGSRLPGTSSVS